MPITLSSTTPLSLIDSCTKMPGLRCYFLAKAKVIIATAVSVHRNLSTGESKEQRYIYPITQQAVSLLSGANFWQFKSWPVLFVPRYKDRIELCTNLCPIGVSERCVERQSDLAACSTTSSESGPYSCHPGQKTW